METIEELKEIICKKAKEHALAEDKWEYESIELDSFISIIQFLLAKGFEVEGIDFDVLLGGYDEESNKDPDKDQWYYFEKILEIMEEMIAEDTLPLEAKHLYVFWRDTLWG